ncbi:ATP-binding protein [Flavivirga rizhaonensis]|uniref:Transcriptional regulator n=1 Tax=Flavivirga rizhaonensis TaxID=2559571 RepID=A0A4S1E013_9FLAO|nr:ATP-binding protein [Flavivirga rizhaonensis]TGV03625.1 transcriptional regulator [Flavivirga rizhaonensis]
MLEKQNIEWKESWRNEYFEWISAFANAEGGKLFIGINDKGEVVGVDDYEKLLVNLPNQIRDLLGVICEVNHHSKDDLNYIEIVINAYSVPISYKGKYYIRSGSTTQTLNGATLNDFLLKKAGVNWDEVIEPKASIKDIDLNAVEVFKKSATSSNRLFFSKSDTDTEAILKNLRLIDNDGNYKRAAILLFGKDPLAFCTPAFIKIGKFGDTGSELLNQDEVEGNAFEQADKVLEVLDKKYFTKSISYEGNQRIETPEYPYAAIREILLNAIAHRVYETSAITVRIFEDRLEIWNIGELPEQLSTEDLKTTHNSYPRNPLIAQVFYKGGLIESWGRGTIKIIEECKRHGLSEPHIEEKGGGVSVTIFKDIYNDKYLSKLDLNERQKNAIQYIKENGFITSGLYQDKLDVPKSTTRRDIDELLELKIIKSEGIGKATKYFICAEGYRS